MLKEFEGIVCDDCEEREAEVADFETGEAFCSICYDPEDEHCLDCGSVGAKHRFDCPNVTKAGARSFVRYRERYR